MKKRNLLFLSIAFVLASAFFLKASYDEAKKTAVSKLHEEQTIHAKQAARGIEEFFATWTGVLTSLSQMNEIKDTSSDGRRYMEFFYKAHKDQIRSITRVDEKGIILYTVPYNRSIGNDISGQGHMREILRDQKPVVSDVFRATQGFDGVALHVPVFNKSMFKGTIAIVVNFESLAQHYLEVIKIGDTGHAWVVSRDGTELYSPVTGHTGKSVFENYKNVPAIISMAKDMLKGNVGVAAYDVEEVKGQSVKRVRNHAVYMPVSIGNTFWSIVVASSEDEVFSSLASFRNRLIMIMVVILFGGVVLAAVGAKAWLIVAEEEKRKKAEEVLRNSEEKFFKAFHATPDAIVISRASDGLLLEVNEVFLRLSGYSRDGALNRTTVELNLWADPHDRDRYVASVREQGTVREMEARFRTRSGKILDGLVSGESIVLGDEPCLLTIIRDITERKRTDEELQKHRLHLEDMVRERTHELEAANNKLRELDRLKSLFIASMSHELRTPLNSIIGFTGILLQGLAGPLNDEQRKQLGMVKGSSQHLLDLITDIIDLSKIEAGKIEFTLAGFDLIKVIREVAASFGPAAGVKGIAVVTDGAETLVVKSDQRRIRQVLVNLVGNAVKFTDSGEVRVSAAGENGVAIIAVRDTGPGIRQEDMEKLFQFFSQITSADMAKHEGTGLGLYLSKRLMNLLGGDIRAESEFGRGSVFTVTLPFTVKGLP